MDHSQHMDHMNHSVHDHSGHSAHIELTTAGHDHNHGGGHEGHEGHEGHNQGSAHDHMMMMVFHFGCKEQILFEKWSIDSVGGLIASVLVIAVMAAFYEGLKYYREYLFWKTYNSLQYRAVTLPDKVAVVGTSSEDTSRVKPKMTSLIHIYQTFLHVVQVTLSFLLMLIFMTYNVWLCLGVVFGAAVGYFMFGWKKSVIVDITEHCH